MTTKLQNQFPKTVIVIGHGRSGTSLTAGMLKILGVDVGINARPDKDNPRGRFEDESFEEMNIKIVNYKDKEDKSSEVKQKLSNEIKTLIKRKSKNKLIWGWKHPFTIFTIDFFLPYLLNPYFIFVFRNPIDVVNSTLEFGHGGKMNFFQAFQSVNSYNKEILNFLVKHPDLPKIFITFENIISNPVKEAKRLSDFLGLELKEKQIIKINKFVIPRKKIKQEKRKATLIEPFTFRAPRFIKKCLKNPLNIPSYIYLAFKNNIYKEGRKK